MKHLLLALTALVGIFSVQSCKEDVDLIGEFTETAIIYGLLDKADTVHMIKINRAFIGPGNSLQIAQIPDSSYFKQVTATVTEVGGLNRVWTLQDTIIDNKDPNGVFYAPNQKLYYFETFTGQPLNEAAKYILNVSVNNGEFEITGETGLVSGITSTLSSQNTRFTFSDDPGKYVSTLIQVKTGNASIVNTSITVNYNEYIAGVPTKKSFNWVVGELESSATNLNETIAFNANGETFYNLMKSSCQAASPLVERRTVTSFDVRITGGSTDFYNYILVNKPSSSLAQTKPTFTNLTATNGHPVIGIFSSRFTFAFEKTMTVGTSSFLRALDKKSTSELCIGPITGLFFFCSDHPGDNGETYDC